MAETGQRNTRIRPALVGLLVLLAFSLAAAWGRKPPKEEEIRVTLRPISASEAMDILRRFPQMVPCRFVAVETDSVFLRDLFNFSELTAPLLSRVFPEARFYHGVGFDEMPGSPYLMAIAGDKRYMMPAGFNRLLFDNGMKVTDRNTLALAQALTVLTVEGEYGSVPQITFRDAQRIDTVIGRITWNAKLNVEFGERVEVWHFARWHDGFGVVSRGTGDGQLIKQYDLLGAEPPPKR